MINPYGLERPENMNRRNFILALIAAASAFVSRSLKAAGRADCYTTADVSGPFHRPGAPIRTNLAAGYSKSNKGEPLQVFGTVYGGDCNTPLKDAQLDLWHADPTGEYDMHSDLFLFRARVRMDNIGNYQYETLMPAAYRDAGMNRPKHIHYMVTAPGHKNLVTQLYFQGDPRLDNDPFVNQNGGMTRAMAYTRDSNGVNHMRFDIYLEAL